MTTIAIIGPGAVGGTVAAWLAQNPQNQIVVAARTAVDHLEVETPSGPITATPRVLTDPAAATPVDWVLIATKTYDAAGAAPWLRGFCRADTRVAVLQNGVEHVERFAQWVAPANLLPVVVDCPAERNAPGRIRQRRAAWMIVPADARGQAFAALFAGTGIEIRLEADFRTHAWRKLCLNNAGAVSAILLQPAGVAHREPVAELMRGLVRECLAVGRAEGAVLDDSLVDTVVEAYRSAPPDAVNSLHADRRDGRPMEIDARHGVVVRLGRRHGIATPLNAAVAALLEAAQG